jgi:hypothetical protein
LAAGNLAALPLALLLGAVVALLAGPTRAAAFALSFVGLALPWLAEPPWLRFLTALAAAMTVFRALDLLRDPRQWSAGRRLWLMFAVFDSREARFVPPALERRVLAMAVGFAALATAAGMVIVRTDVLLVRWLAGVVFVYACADCAGHTMHTLMRAIGVGMPPFHEHPILARSLTEFWGARWNLTVRALLDRHAFRPLARRRMARLGLAAAFALSAVLHFYLLLAALGPRWALWWLAFFSIHGALVLVENRLGVTRWRRAAGHAWTAAWFLVTSPLFVEPTLVVMFG